MKREVCAPSSVLLNIVAAAVVIAVRLFRLPRTPLSEGYAVHLLQVVTIKMQITIKPLDRPLKESQAGLFMKFRARPRTVCRRY